MNLYMIRGRDAPGSLTRRRAARPAHVARMEILRDAGRLVLAGPLPAIDSPDPGPAGFNGSLIVAAFESLEAARQWAETDPYRTEGVFEHVDVRPFVRVLP